MSIDKARERINLLLEAAKSSTAYSYSPYSKFKVGCALLTSDFSIISGTNIENASYGLTICAEKCAISKAVSQGHNNIIMAIVYASGREKVCSPCGACRQILYEFGGPNMIMIMSNDSEIKEFKLSELLPLAFGPQNFKN